MSVSDPLLRTLKQIIISLCFDETGARKDLKAEPITDTSAELQSLCEILESILRQGLKSHPQHRGSTATLRFKDYFHVFASLPPAAHAVTQHEMHGGYTELVRVVGEGFGGRLTCLTSKGRVMLRALMQRGLLHVPFQLLLAHPHQLAEQFYDAQRSIVANEILGQILLSLLQQIDQMEFRLYLKNALFLHESWSMPEYLQIEFVPCRRLGVRISYLASGHVIVNSILPGSVAEEDGRLAVGDVIDELFGQPVTHTSRDLIGLMRKHRMKPVPLSVIKLKRLPPSEQPPFQPLMRLLRKNDRSDIIQASLKNALRELDESCADVSKSGNASLPIFARLREDQAGDTPAQNPLARASFFAQFIGTFAVGPDGGVHQIEWAIEMTLRAHSDPAKFRAVQLEIGEKDVIVRSFYPASNGDDDVTGEVGGASREDGKRLGTGSGEKGGGTPTQLVCAQEPLFQHAYPQISSCGRRVDCNRFFAYIAGETTCTISTQFVCYLFEAHTEFDSKTILSAIAQGFERTHWAL